MRRAFELVEIDRVQERHHLAEILADPLDELIWHWGMAYRIWAAGGTWYARRNGRGEIMQATDPERLSFMIRDDYFHRAGPDGPSAGS